MKTSFSWLRRWEALLAIILVIVLIRNVQLSPFFLQADNLLNLFEVSIEKIIVAMIMTFVIINGEIDLSVASIMGMCGCLFSYLLLQGWQEFPAIIASLLLGVVAGAVNGFFTAYVGLPSLVVTLAGLISYRGIALLMIEDRSVKNIPQHFIDLATQPTIGPISLTLAVFIVFFIIAFVVLHFTAFGRHVFIIGNNKDAARFSGVDVKRVKMTLFVVSGFVSALAGLFYAWRLGAVRSDLAQGFELDIITMVLLGGVSIFGGSGTFVGVGLSILIVLSLRNGMSLDGVTGNTQSAVIGVLLILSVLIPNLLQEANRFFKQRGSAVQSGS
ncbi:MAG: ABC transporter permease [Anaerolineae bacterium]|nr:ABC transporter permease [Anaerolineae bacterium]